MRSDFWIMVGCLGGLLLPWVAGVVVAYIGCWIVERQGK